MGLLLGVLDCRVTSTTLSALPQEFGWLKDCFMYAYIYIYIYIAHLRQGCHKSKCVTFQEKLLKVVKCYKFLWVKRRHDCPPAASFANRVMTLNLLKVHLQTFLSTPVTQKCQILICYTVVAKELYIHVCVCVCVRVRFVCVSLRACVYVCVRVLEKESQKLKS